MATLAKLHGQLKADPIRKKRPFSADLAEVQDQLCAQGLSDLDRFEILRPWLELNQPCLFGRLSAKQDRLGFCILTFDDIMDGDAHVRDKIQKARLQWKRDAYRAKKSGFIIAAITPELISAEPNEKLMAFALQLTKLYLNEEPSPDRVHLDWVTLKENADTAIKWRVGANFFASAGDGRWWHDHRIPGGVALSMNSVGHMTKSSSALAAQVGGKKTPDDLAEALRLAMQTISKAAPACSGRATELLPRDPTDDCPHPDDKWPPGIRNKHRRTYQGWYHTDFTIPSDYFRGDITRPAKISTPFDLDFSYLWNDSIENPDFQTMGVGEEVPV